MEVKRYLLGGNPSAQITHLPDSCVRERTITLNKMKVLHIFRDRRAEAIAWIEDNLPRLAIMDKHQMDKFKKWFWLEMPDNGFLEFDFGKKTLCLCVLEKAIPK